MTTHHAGLGPEEDGMSETTSETAEMRAWKCLDCGMEGEATDIPTAQEHHTSIHGCRGLCGWMPPSPQRAAAREETRSVFDLANEFHAHLDACVRCRTQPFSLCPIGAKLLTEAGGKVLNG